MLEVQTYLCEFGPYLLKKIRLWESPEALALRLRYFCSYNVLYWKLQLLKNILNKGEWTLRKRTPFTFSVTAWTQETPSAGHGQDRTTPIACNDKDISHTNLIKQKGYKKLKKKKKHVENSCHFWNNENRAQQQNAENEAPLGQICMKLTLRGITAVPLESPVWGRFNPSWGRFSQLRLDSAEGSKHEAKYHDQSGERGFGLVSLHQWAWEWA